MCINVSSKLKKKGENEADGKNALDTEWPEVTEGLKIGRGAQCFHMEVKVAVLSAISQSCN